MAIFHLSVKPICRSAGRSATAAAAYRSGCKIVDRRTGEIHDYRRRKGVESTHIVVPMNGPDWAKDRSKLWNAAEAAEKRKDACVAREIVLALPAELSVGERQQLALDFAAKMANAEKCVVDVAIHSPSQNGDDRNFHAHILRTTRKLEVDGLGEKLDTEKSGRNRVADLNSLRQLWSKMVNHFLQKKGVDARVDHRSLQNQGLSRKPGRHLGPVSTRFKKRDEQQALSQQKLNEPYENYRALIEQLKMEIQLEQTSLDAAKLTPTPTTPSLLAQALAFNHATSQGFAPPSQSIPEPGRKRSNDAFDR